jgi:hypothetical protein
MNPLELNCAVPHQWHQDVERDCGDEEHHSHLAAANVCFRSQPAHLLSIFHATHKEQPFCSNAGAKRYLNNE